MIQYRDYQQKLHDEIIQAWNSGTRVLGAEAPTGSGKTVLISGLIAELNVPTVVQAHRQELVGQISMALAENGTEHSIIAPEHVQRAAQKAMLKKLGKSFYNMRSKVRVASVNTLTSKTTMPKVKIWAPEIGLWIMDEGHHVLKDNMWGRSVELFPQAYGLGVSAWFGRADGKGLGSHADGVYQKLIRGPNMGDLITIGHLSNFMLYGMPPVIDTEGLQVSKVTGDYASKKLTERSRKSTIVGDVVEHYLRLAKGKRGVTFVTDIQTAKDIAADFNKNGIPATAIDSNTPSTDRTKILEQFASGEILNIVNVDIFSEGFDCPAIEVVSFARPTASYGLYIQQFGRALRILAGKDHAIIIDHVGNVERFGLPTNPRNSGLDRREAKSTQKDDDAEIKLKTCKNPVCTLYFEAYRSKCPWCGHEVKPAGRSLPEQVAGDLTLLSTSYIEKIEEKIQESHIDVYDRVRVNQPDYIAKACANKHLEKQVVQDELHETIAQWSGIKLAEGMSTRDRQRLFYMQFEVDVLTCKTWKKKEMEHLIERINKRIEL